MKRWLIWIFLVAGLFMIMGLSFAEETPGITFVEETYTVAVGKNIPIKTVISPKNSIKKLEWSSSNEEVATVNAKGAVKGVSVGETVVTVRDANNPEIHASVTIKVVIPVKKLVLSDKNVSLPVDYTWNLTATITPEDATNKELTWSSSNENVAVVDQNGTITGISKGSAKITAATLDGSNLKVVITVNVDEYDLIVKNPFGTQTQVSTNVYAVDKIKVSSKNKVVQANMTGEGSVWRSNGKEYITYFTVKPLKTGTDVLTFKLGRSKLVMKVFVAQNAFTVLDEYEQEQENKKKEEEEKKAAEEKAAEEKNNKMSFDELKDLFNQTIIIGTPQVTDDQKILLSFGNASSEHIISTIYFTVECFDSDGNPFVCNTDGKSVSFSGYYPLELFPGEWTVKGRFVFSDYYRGDPLIDSVRVTVTGFLLDGDKMYAFPEELQKESAMSSGKK